MELFNASIGGPPDGVGTHFGTLLAAIHRIETIFSQRETSHYRDGKFYIYGPQKAYNRVPSANTLRRVESPAEHFRVFADFIKGCTFYKATIEFNKTLQLEDCWGDDPLGSGGTDILKAANLGENEARQATRIFHPFSGVIYPEDIDRQLKSSDLKSMEKAVRGNSEFREKLFKRRRMMGDEVFALDKNPEIVWQYMTMKFHQWATQRGYDSFTYKNKEEGHGEPSFVSLSKNSIKGVEAFTFDGDALYNEILPIYPQSVHIQFLAAQKGQDSMSSAVLAESIWRGMNIEKYLVPKSLATDHVSRVLSSRDEPRER